MQHQLREIQQTFSVITHAVNTKVKKQTELRAISKELNYFKGWKIKGPQTKVALTKGK